MLATQEKRKIQNQVLSVGELLVIGAGKLPLKYNLTPFLIDKLMPMPTWYAQCDCELTCHSRELRKRASRTTGPLVVAIPHFTNRYLRNLTSPLNGLV
jgi:hypothetical protein